MFNRILGGTLIAVILAGPAWAEKYTLITGVDARLWPGSARSVTPLPGPGFPGTFYDGDRLAGTSDVGPTVSYVGLGTPLFQPNEFGSTSFLYHRGSVPLGPPGQLPLMGVDFLGGVRLDLDGDSNDAGRSLIPVTGQSPVAVTGLGSFVELRFDTAAGDVELLNIDATGNNEGGPNIQAETATVLVTLAGTSSTGETGAAINPGVDTRLGTLTPFTGGGSLTGVYQIADLGFEFWYDSIDPTSSTAGALGTVQWLGVMSGWMIERDSTTGQFPTLSGEGLGTTIWPLVDDQYVSDVYNSAISGTATISAGSPADLYTAANNGGLALTDFGGDIGAYLDNVIVPLLPASAQRFVYLDAAGCGVSNSSDPVFFDTIAYDVVLIAVDESCPGDINMDGQVDLADLALLLAAYGSSTGDAAYNSDADFNGNGAIGLDDLAALLSVYGTLCQ